MASDFDFEHEGLEAFHNRRIFNSFRGVYSSARNLPDFDVLDPPTSIAMATDHLLKYFEKEGYYDPKNEDDVRRAGLLAALAFGRIATVDTPRLPEEPNGN